MNTSYLLVIVSGIISGFIVFGGQILARMGFSLFQISTLPYIFSLVLIAPVFFLIKRSKNLKEALPILLLYGFVEAGINLCQFAAPILGASIAITVLLLYVQPLWTTLSSWLFLKEKITKINIIACAMVLFGVVLIVNPFNIENVGSWAGIIVAFLGGIFLSGWVSVGSHLSKKGVKPIETMFLGSLIMLIILSITFPIAKNFITDQALVGFSFDKNAIAWIVIFGFGIVAFIVNHFVYLQGTKKVPTADAGIIMLIEPVVGTTLAIIFFHQLLTPSIIIGGILILFANYLIIAQGRKISKIKRVE
jgi:drug/metabolite transporter (DMT)-like permease